MFYNNINGLSTKINSLENILSSVTPDIIAICETKKGVRLKKNELQDYDVLESIAEVGKEGFIIGARKNSFNTIREITDTDMKNIMTVRIEYPKFNVRVIAVHAPQETAKKEERIEFFEELMVQVERGNSSDDYVLLVGDLNARLMLENEKVNADDDSPNGKKLLEVINEYSMKVCNFSGKCSGKWTRIQGGKNGVEKSTIDYMIVQSQLCNAMGSLLVDEDKIFTPYRVTKVKGTQKITYTDHCAMIACFELETGHVVPPKSKKRCWKFNDNEGMERYKMESTYSLQFDSTGTSTEGYANWVTQFEKLLGKCFEMITIKESSGPTSSRNIYNTRAVIAELSKKGKVQRKIAKIYQEKLVALEIDQMAKNRAEVLKRTMSQLTANEKFSPAGYWKIKTAMKKNERKVVNSSPVVKGNGVVVDGPAGVREAYKEEFENRLSSREPASGWEKFVEETNKSVRKWLRGESRRSLPFTLKELKQIVMRLKNNKCPGVDGFPAELFKFAGDGVLKSLLTIFNKVKSTRETPDQWNLVRIATIYKNKGSKKELKNYRGIFLTVVISKIFENLIKGRIESKLDQVNLLQAGSRKNRAGPDNVFLLRACVDHFKFTKQPLFLTAYDFEQAFDSLWLEDCILSMKRLGVEKEYLQLIYSLNKNATVTVQTPYGETSPFKSDPIVKQGTILGPSLCSSSTGEYCDINPGVCVGNLVISSLLFVDDIVDLSSTLEDCETSHKNAVHFAKKKKLIYSGTKCFNMVINGKRKVDPPNLEIDASKKVLTATEIAYLGDIFNSKGNNDGLIADRLKRGTKAMISISALMSEVDVGIYRISSFLLLYNSLFLMTMLFNSQTWSNLRKQDIKALTTIQLKFLKRIVGVCSSTSNSFIFLELGVLPIEHEIGKRQIMFLHRILQLEEDDPVNIMFWNLKLLHEAGESNWWSDVVRNMERYNLVCDLDEIKTISKNAFSNRVKKAVIETAFTELKDSCRSLKKTADLSYQKFETQEYLLKMFPSQAKTIFKWRSKTLDIKTHLTYKYTDTLCRGCGIAEESVDHVINCGVSSAVVAEETSRLEKISPEKYLNLQAQARKIMSFIEEYSL